MSPTHSTHYSSNIVEAMSPALSCPLPKLFRGCQRSENSGREIQKRKMKDQLYNRINALPDELAASSGHGAPTAIECSDTTQPKPIHPKSERQTYKQTASPVGQSVASVQQACPTIPVISDACVLRYPWARRPLFLQDRSPSCLTCGDLQSQFHTLDIRNIWQSADAGCEVCSFLRTGITAIFKNLKDIETVHLSSYERSHPLGVGIFHTGKMVWIQFYTLSSMEPLENQRTQILMSIQMHQLNGLLARLDTYLQIHTQMNAFHS